MDKDQQEQKRFLEEQLQWTREQDRILEEIDEKLHEMKRIAEYALEHEPSVLETNKLNSQLKELKDEVQSLERQLQSMIH
ncbi:hypothetical protein [Bacillus solitudinis]|uniref:hypothetical protein n=1 Tax=Bacillus solitudinis TaxID=2014074 RepID=UPI000C2444C0|nr:hypothetical protein [Bacillus solitudinis]